MHQITRRFQTAALLRCLGLLAFGAGTAARAQTPDAQPPRLAGSSFVAARYKMGSTASLFAAGRVGAGMAVVGVIANPETDYGAFVAGPGTRVRIAPAAAATVIVAGASASDGASLRLYVMPSVALGPAAISAIAAAYQPLSGANRAQVLIDPVIVWVRVGGALRTGVAGVWLATDGRVPDVGIGPVAQLRLPSGFLALELVARSRRMGPELRGTFNAAL